MPPDDSLRAALDAVFAGPAYRWVERPDPLRLLREWVARLSDWLAALREGSPIWYRALIVVLMLVLLAILAHAAWLFWLTLRRAAHSGGGARPVEAPRPPDAQGLRGEAERAARDGRLAEALRLGFLALALDLDARGSVVYSPGKTPGDYAREARLVPEDRSRLRTLVSSLYRHVYGAVPVSREECARWLADAGREWHAPPA